MTTNYVNSGERITYTIPKGAPAVYSGHPVELQGKLFIALNNGTEGDEVCLARCGRFTLPKGWAEEIFQGQTVYWYAFDEPLENGMYGVVTAYSGRRKCKMGIAAADAGKTDPDVDVILITNF